jgi:hypothetical protein
MNALRSSPLAGGLLLQLRIRSCCDVAAAVGDAAVFCGVAGCCAAAGAGAGCAGLTSAATGSAACAARGARSDASAIISALFIAISCERWKGRGLREAIDHAALNVAARDGAFSRKADPSVEGRRPARGPARQERHR